MGKAEVTKALLLKKAAEVVVEKGFYTSSTKEIAEAAGVSEGTLFKYFKSKENLLKEIIFELVAKLKEETLEKSLPAILTTAHSATEKLVYLYEDRRQFFDDYETVIRIVLQELAINKTVKELFKLEILPMINQVVESIMIEGVEKKEFIDISTKTLTVGFINILLAPYLTMILLEHEVSRLDSDHNQALFEIYMNGIKEKAQ
ncbi:MAG: TetR/AcrR family transcriptional regulator [Vallitaleaceae bacterium]|jgi:AcrR family transcriptional regulator|nr:TetR/AcrR family transcriptional regulator [Vallitaleaceae bacterium]